MCSSRHHMIERKRGEQRTRTTNHLRHNRHDVELESVHGPLGVLGSPGCGHAAPCGHSAPLLNKNFVNQIQKLCGQDETKRDASDLSRLAQTLMIRMKQGQGSEQAIERRNRNVPGSLWSLSLSKLRPFSLLASLTRRLRAASSRLCS